MRPIVLRMKVLLLFFLFVIASKAWGAIPAPTYTLHVSYNLPTGYPNKGGDHISVGGTLYVYTSDPLGEIRNPIIMPEGFDAENERGWEELYERMNAHNMIECLHTAGYDFIVLDYDDGGNYIEHNAYLLSQVITYVNDAKVTAQKNVVVGPSMGGLVSRYALTYMENKNINHDTRLFISFDSPQYGANVPLGLQYVSRYWDGRVGGEDATRAFSIVKSYAARQMLFYHIVRTLETTVIQADPLRVTFLQNLQNLNNWPVKLRKIAISNGSGYGLLQLKSDGVTRLQPGDKILDFDASGGAVFSRAWAVPNATPTKIARCKTFFDADPDDFTVSGTKPYDNMPGGYRNFNEKLKFTNHADVDFQTFIPTFSALAVNTNDNYYNPHADPDVMDKTPFDAIYYPVENQEHVVITAENKGWIFNEIMPDQLLASTTFLQNKPELATIQATEEIRLLPGFSTGSAVSVRFYTGLFPGCVAGAPYEANVDGLLTENKSEIQKELLIYPNPASDHVTIDLQGRKAKELQLLYPDGRLIKTITPGNASSYQLNLNELNSGIYFICVIHDNESTTTKIILRRE